MQSDSTVNILKMKIQPKGKFLVLLWNSLVSAAVWSYGTMLGETILSEGMDLEQEYFFSGVHRTAISSLHYHTTARMVSRC